MNIFIAGGGRVGYHLARLLSSEDQDVTVIENDMNQIEKIDVLDCSTIAGDGRSILLLQSLGVGAADLFVSSMGTDEANLIAAATAKSLGARQVVARVDSPLFIEGNFLYETALDIDYVLSPDAVAALEIANYLEHPGIINSRDFGRGRIQMRQITVTKTPTTGAKALKDVLLGGNGGLVALIERNGAIIIPHGDSQVLPGDQITLIGNKDKMRNLIKLFIDEKARPKKVAILGGGTIGVRLALALEGTVRSIKIIERNHAQAVALSRQFSKVKIVERDGASRADLEQEHIDGSYAFVAATNDDERNIMAAVLAKEVGAKTVVAVVNQPDFAPLVERLGIDFTVSPRASIANSIIKMIHSGEVASLALLSDGQIEVVEYEVDASSPVLGRQIKDFSRKMPKDALITTILRGEKVFVPNGDSEILEGDSVVVLASAEALDQVRKVLKVKR